jgi:hypothetical protein
MSTYCWFCGLSWPDLAISFGRQMLLDSVRSFFVAPFLFPAKSIWEFEGANMTAPATDRTDPNIKGSKL